MHTGIRNLRLTAIASVLLLAPLASQAGVLRDLYQLAQDNDQTLLSARYQRDAAKEAKPQAWGALLPQLSAQAGIKQNRFKVLQVNNPSNTTYKELEETYNSQSYVVQLSQTLFDWTAFKKVAAADATVAQAEAAYRSAEQKLVLRLVGAYLDVLSAQDALRADLDAQSAFKQQYETQEAKYKSGLAAVTDARNAQASYDSSTATVITDTLALNKAKRALSVIIGRPMDRVAPLREEIALAPPNPASVDSWVAAAQDTNLDLMAARYAAEAAGQSVSAAFGAHLPTISAAGVLDREDSASTFGYDAQTAYVGVNLSWPLFRGGQVSSGVRQAEASQKKAQADYQQQLQITNQSVRDHYEGVVSGISAVKASANAVTSQQASVVATEVGFKVGARTIIDALNTRQALVGAQKALAQARYSYLINLLQLKGDVGQLSAADIDDLDALLGGGEAGGARR